MERDLAETSKRPTAHSSVDDPQPESKREDDLLQGLEVGNEASETSEDLPSAGDGTESHLVAESETGVGDNVALRQPLQASPSQLQQWQQEDPTLAEVREAAQDSHLEETGSRVHFFYRNGLLATLAT